MASDLPKFIERQGEPCHQQPFYCYNTQLYGFYVRGERTAIQSQLVDPTLNAPNGGAINYHVFTDFVLVSYANAARCGSTQSPDHDMGWVPENSWTVWVPLIVIKQELGIEVAQRLVFFPAYICVDNSWSVAAGREVYGFPKNYGVVDIPAASDPPLKFSASTLALAKFSPDNEGEMLPVMEVGRTEDGSKAEAVWNDARSAIKDLTAFLMKDGEIIVPGLNLMIDLYTLAKHEEVPAVFLKQFRDASDGTKACYQAIIEANSSVVKLHGGGLLAGKFNVHAADFASNPVASTLGINSAGVQAEFPFWVNMDFEIGGGTEIWRAGK